MQKKEKKRKPGIIIIILNQKQNFCIFLDTDLQLLELFAKKIVDREVRWPRILKPYLQRFKSLVFLLFCAILEICSNTFSNTSSLMRTGDFVLFGKHKRGEGEAVYTPPPFFMFVIILRVIENEETYLVTVCLTIVNTY